MKILHVIPDLAASSGGPVTAVLGMAEAQATLGHTVSIAATTYEIDASPELDGVEVNLFPCCLGRPRWSPQLGQFLARYVSRYDIVHLHTLWQYPTWAGGRACRATGKPYVVTPQGMLDGWSLSQKPLRKRLYLRWVEGNTLRGAAALHATAEGELADSYFDRWNSSLFVLPLGLSRAAYNDLPSPSSFAQRFPAVIDRRIILFLGRLHPKKQPEVAIRAFHRVCQDAKDTSLVLAGPGHPTYLETLHSLVDDLGLTSRVLFTGQLRGLAVREAHRAACVFVLPSWQENFGIAVAEAMASECPVVISDRVDLAPEVQKAEAGLVTEPTLDATAEAIALLLHDEPLRRKMGQNGRRYALERFTWEKIAADLCQVYEDILSGRKRCLAWRVRPSLRGLSARLTASSEFAAKR